MILFVLTALLLAPQAASPGSELPRDIGSRRELSVDYYLIDTMKNVRLELRKKRFQEPLMASPEVMDLIQV